MHKYLFMQRREPKGQNYVKVSMSFETIGIDGNYAQLLEVVPPVGDYITVCVDPEYIKPPAVGTRFLMRENDMLLIDYSGELIRVNCKDLNNPSQPEPRMFTEEQFQGYWDVDQFGMMTAKE